MEGKKEIYADRIVQLRFMSGMVRFDFASLRDGAEDESSVLQSVLRVIMPAQGFLRAFDTMQSLKNRLADAGVLRKGSSAEEKPVEEIPAEKKAEKKTEKKAPASRKSAAEKPAAKKSGTPGRKRKTRQGSPAGSALQE